jgi:hypothetical protein
MIKGVGKKVTRRKLKTAWLYGVAWRNVNEGKKRQHKIRYTKDINL